jgi:uncharacterized protein (DUF3084 family)
MDKAQVQEREMEVINAIFSIVQRAKEWSELSARVAHLEKENARLTRSLAKLEKAFQARNDDE